MFFGGGAFEFEGVAAEEGGGFVFEGGVELFDVVFWHFVFGGKVILTNSQLTFYNFSQNFKKFL